MPAPSDPELYQAVAGWVKRRNPVHSAYRSGAIVKLYKQQFAQIHGDKSSPYRGGRNLGSGLVRWFRERWRNQRGGVGYESRSDVYRPTRRVTRETPLTFHEVGTQGIRLARAEKLKRGFVRSFRALKTARVV